MTRASAFKTLTVLIEGSEAGHVNEGSGGRLDFSYLPEWQENPGATPLSLSMPLARRSHGDAVLRPFLWGLLPDNERVIERWARTYQVSSRNPFALLRHVGEDVAGAAQFVSPDRHDAVRSGRANIEWLTTSEVEAWLVTVVRDPTQWHLQGTGQFSLAGAQPKGALYYDDEQDRWGVPHGATPTTHILKPAVVDLDGHDLNEHLCLETARRVGLSAARTEVRSFGGERAIVVERYDRERQPDGTVRRIHQEDICQALGVSPAATYQSDGGPGPAQIVGLLRRETRTPTDAADDVLRFVDALALNWVLAGTDAHAKNYSVLLRRREVRLTPLYDVASMLPYPAVHEPKLKLAMAIGGEYRIGIIERRYWQRLAADLGLDADDVVARVDHIAAAIPAQMAAAASSSAVHAQ